MRAKVIRVRCKTCRAQQEFFFRIIHPWQEQDGDPRLMNALDPKAPDPYFFLRAGAFLHVPYSDCQSLNLAYTRQPDARICPVCLRPSPDEPDRVACKFQDCRAKFVKVSIESGTGSHLPRKRVVDFGGAT